MVGKYGFEADKVYIFGQFFSQKGYISSKRYAKLPKKALFDRIDLS